MNKDGNKKLAIGALIGAAVGVITGLLTAPKSGKETRQDIKDTASKVFAEAEKKLKTLHTELSELIDKGSVELIKHKGKAKVELEKALAAAKQAQTKAKEVISAVRNGETVNPELEKAIKEITKAKDHLKKYLKS
jgi:gas vesicle protein